MNEREFFKLYIQSHIRTTPERLKIENLDFNLICAYGLSLRQIDFKNCDFHCTDFDFSRITNCIFTDCDFSGCSFKDCYIVNCKFIDCDLDRIKINNADIHLCEGLESTRKKDEEKIQLEVKDYTDMSIKMIKDNNTIKWRFPDQTYTVSFKSNITSYYDTIFKDKL